MLDLTVLTPQIQTPLTNIVIKQEPVKPKEILYTIRGGDSLEKIAGEQHSTVSRLFSKNTSITDPNQIEVGQSLVIPAESEILPERAMISAGVQPVNTNSSVSVGSFSISSGAYGVGWCTSWAASRHPVPNNLGNADTWLYMAKADGLATGSEPRVGSIAVAGAYMHVAIVEKVENGRVYISEMNYVKYGDVDYRWTDLSEWQGYIYN